MRPQPAGCASFASLRTPVELPGLRGCLEAWTAQGAQAVSIHPVSSIPIHHYTEEHMNPVVRKAGITLAGVTLMASVLVAGTGLALAGTTHVTLSGSEEVPPVQTSASGKGTITVKDDKSVSGSVTTKGIKATMAHIHEAAPGQNGGVAIPLTRKGDDEWMVPAGAKLTDEQYQAYKAGNLYVNVHSEAHKAGEIRGQLKP
jgi:CHRD domain-containing protein